MSQPAPTASPSREPASRPALPAVLATVCFAVVLATVEGWALHAADPDFPLADPFHGLAIGLLALFALAAVVRDLRLRLALLTTVYALPVGVLAAELYYEQRDLRDAGSRIAPSEDLLLRYTYRPGAVVRAGPGDGPAATMPVTEDGLLDLPHAVPRPPDVDRVVVLGDSVPNDPSIPFEERFPRRLEALLAARAPPGRRPEVVNVSCEGYNTLQEERLLERVGLRYEPSVVVVAYVLNDPFLQNGAYRRFGNSFFAFQLQPLLGYAAGRSACEIFAPLHAGYPFELVVRGALERLRLHAERDRFQVLVAPLPIVESFEDPVCLGLYDKVLAVGRDQGFEGTRVVDAFHGEDHEAYRKPGARFDVTHPAAAGHERIARHLAEAVAPLLWPAEALAAP